MQKHPERKQSGNTDTIVSFRDHAEFIKKFSLSRQDETYCLEQLTTEGPEHKQAYATLLLKRMDRLLSALQKSSGQAFTPQGGYSMACGRHQSVPIPIPLPSSSLKKADAKHEIEVLSKSPEHEGVLFNLLLQAIEWSIKHTGTGEASS